MKIVLMRRGKAGRVVYLSRNPKRVETEDFGAAFSFLTSEQAWEAASWLNAKRGQDRKTASVWRAVCARHGIEATQSLSVFVA